MPVTIQKLGMGDDKIVKIILAVLSCMKLLKKWLLRLSPAVILGSKTFAKVLETVWKQVKFNGYITAMHSRKKLFGPVCFQSAFSCIQTEYENLLSKISIFSPNAEQYGPQKLQIPTPFTQCCPSRNSIF